jgi:flagellar export protein FliJ
VLELRRREAEAARGALQRAQLLVRAGEDAVGGAEERRDRARAGLAAAMARTTTSAEIAQHRAWIDRMESTLRDSRAALERQRMDAQAAAVALADAQRRVRVLERLRERAWRRHVEAERLAERRTLDEFATLAHARRREEERARGY